MTRLLEVVRLRHALRVLIFRLTRGMLTSASKSYRLFEASLRFHQYQQASLIAETARLRWPDAARDPEPNEKGPPAPATWLSVSGRRSIGARYGSERQRGSVG